ncbi:phage portal protein [Rufibacter roseus]|uniref:Phage portal protein n=1 Tax=Rufibacter roseus TaxID=1567108 RepID=A0ABW2DND0_9BACT|nr:phage portal protein [Rufibacter roseus]
MNFLERTKTLYQAALLSYDLPMAVKALGNTSVTVQQLNEALYQFHNKGQLMVPAYDSAKSSKAYVTIDDIYSIVNYIITTASPIPWRVMVRQPDGSAKAENGPLQHLIDNPNPHQGREQIVEALLGYKLLNGNTYLWAPRLEVGANKGKAKEMYVLPANRTKIVFGNAINPVGGYKLSYTNYSKEDFKPEDVLHSKYFNPDVEEFGDMYGLSKLRAAAKRMAIAGEIATAQGTSFKNMGPKGVLARDGDEFTETQATNLEKRFRQKYMGSHNAGAIPMTGGSVKWVPMGLSPVDLDLIESEKWTFDKLCNVFKFPSQVLNNGGEGTTFSNKLEAKKMLYTDCIIPELQSVIADFNRWLPMYYDPSGNTYVELDTSGISILQEDKKAQAEMLNAAWWVSVDRKQEILGETVDPKWKGVYMVPMNMVPVTDPSDFTRATDIEEEVKRLKEKGISDYT